VKLWIDECLTPTLVARANHRGYWATCNRDRDLLGVTDKNLHELVIDEEAVFVTNDEADFVALYRQVDLHTGLLILPQTDRREALWPLLDAALDYIEQKADAAGEATAEWMLNKRVEVNPSGKATHDDLPGADWS
jgi:predicted nuclease of predicted toxin-antitoxin system